MNEERNTLGKSSLWLGIASSAMVFAIGLCALSGAQQGWLAAVAVPLFVCGATSAFLGFLALVLGVAGIASGTKAKATAIVGLVLGILGICLFFFVMSAISQGG